MIGGGVIATTASHVVISDEQYEQYKTLTVNSEGTHVYDGDALAVLRDIVVHAVLPPVAISHRYAVPDGVHVIPVFGGCCVADLHHEHDLAVLHPLSCNAFPINMFGNGYEFLVDIEALLGYNYDKKCPVMKCGCATATTHGIIKIAADPFFSRHEYRSE